MYYQRPQDKEGDISLDTSKLQQSLSIPKNIDRITEAFKGDRGPAMQEVSRNRIHWMCSKAAGETILDVGCSQGIVTIILAREGKRATGIDICKESIDYANTCLESEDETIRIFAEFKYTDFISHINDTGQIYDCIIMGEILEHLADPQRFVKYAYDYLQENGTLVVTVPFGINDYHDHKRTYYLTEIYNTVSMYFSVTEVEFLGGWIGLVCAKASTTSVALDGALFAEAERAFYVHERKLLDQQHGYTSDRDNQLIKLKSEKDSILTQLAAISKQQTDTQIKMADALAKHSAERTELLQKVSLSTTELGKALQLLEKAETDLKTLREKASTLQKENSKYRWQIGRITDTWYGKFAIRCYRRLNKIRRRITRSR